MRPPHAQLFELREAGGDVLGPGGIAEEEAERLGIFNGDIAALADVFRACEQSGIVGRMRDLRGVTAWAASPMRTVFPLTQLCSASISRMRHTATVGA